jgi:uncharacterized protein YbjT (DUF2867 family)
MKVLIIGATGQTGGHAVRQLLARGDEETAFARNPAAVTEISDRLHVVRGDARDTESIDPQSRDKTRCLLRLAADRGKATLKRQCYIVNPGPRYH